MDTSLLGLLGGLGGMGNGGGGPDLSKLTQVMGMLKQNPAGGEGKGLDMGALTSMLGMMGNLNPQPPAAPTPEPTPSQPPSPCQGCSALCPRADLELPEYEEARRRAEICTRF